MIDLSLMRPFGGWRHTETPAGQFWFCGFEQTRSPATLADELLPILNDPDAVRRWLAGLDGAFALAAGNGSTGMAAVDRVRSVPLLYIVDGDTMRTATSAVPIEQADHRPAVSDDMAHAFALSGFTIGPSTLFEGVRQFCPGEWMHSSLTPGVVVPYHAWNPARPTDWEDKDLDEPLAALNRRVIEKLIARADGRTVLAPLSAGLDSRMIVSGLAEAGYRNVTCFAYGRPGNREATASREIAARLGYDWHFVEYSRDRVKKSHESPQHRRYLEQSDSLTSVHFPQDYPAIVALQDAGIVPEDAIVANGQSGDFISGNHIPAAFATRIADQSKRTDRILDALMRKHFGLWRSGTAGRLVPGIRASLMQRLEELGGLPDDETRDHGLFELSEFEDRQSKYVVNGQRAYEFLGLDWHLPLWDREYLDFWELAPFESKFRQTLYKRVLQQQNWGGVWDIPVNATRIRPLWIVPVRVLAKALHAPLGRERWHRFERRYLAYFMDTLNSYAPWPYATIANDVRTARNALSFHVEAYLARKGLDWLGNPQRHDVS